MTKPKGEEKKETKEIKETIIWWPIILLIAVALGIGLWAGFGQTGKTNKSLKNSVKTEIATSTEDVIAAVGKLIILPAGQPEMAIIDDTVDTMKISEPFLKDAIPGDRILVYPDRAIIYRPRQNIIVNVSSVSIVKTADTGESWTIEIRNGSQVKGAATKMAESLKTDSLFQVQAAANAFKDDYQGNQIINFSAKDASELAKKFNATVLTELPKDEATSSADIILILGN